ncbi:MAG: hypothetical protein ACRDOJ_00085, partial [Nocardioidaceae bacterium]
MDGTTIRRLARSVGLVLGLALTVVAVPYLVRAGDVGVLRTALDRLLGDPVGLLLALLAYAGAFGLRSWAWRRVLPALSRG